MIGQNEKFVGVFSTKNIFKLFSKKCWHRFGSHGIVYTVRKTKNKILPYEVAESWGKLDVGICNLYIQ